MYGYSGNVLRVNLTRGAIEVEHPDELFYRTYLGGSAMGLYYLLRLSPQGVDPLGPNNVLTLALSAPTGTPIAGQSRATAVAKSPLTGAVGDSQAGGYWPAELKFAGFDAVVIEGKASQPVYLWVHDGRAELRDASRHWGKVTGEVEATIHRELGDDKIQVAQCGPAGEKLVRFAAIMNMSNRAHGRTGMGAVMGSKNLKAIAVRGKARPPVANPEALRKLAMWGVKNVPTNLSIAELGIDGTDGFLQYRGMTDTLPSYNYSSGAFPNWKEIAGERMSETILKRRDSCYACAVRCKRVVEVTGEPYTVDPHYGGPEYETVSTFGTYCGVSDLVAIAKANELCNKYGVDSISCGATIAFAMDCYEHGILTRDDTGGIDLRFGSAQAMLKMLEMILERKGIGEVLAEGSQRAAEKIGRGAVEFAVTVKGNEVPAHMPQHKRALGLVYAVNPFGADHQSSEHDPSYSPHASEAELDRLARLGLVHPDEPQALGPEKVRFALVTQYLYGALDSIDLCQFVWGGTWQLYGPDQIVELVRAVTGWDIDLPELMKAGERRLNLMRAFNAREGIGRERDTLPKKLFQPLAGGKTEGWRVEPESFEKALDMYYEQAGWDVSTGYPTQSRLEELGLGWVLGQQA